ncbi:MAG TPA: hypothetical protein VG013_42380 [Gemmataceae bacterium]|jgi:hypothetical protein|nr:hypothetical protein [Gemmataceae bacterium]
MPEQLPNAADTAAKVPPPAVVQVEGLRGVASLDEQVEKRVDDIEMIGEEEATGWHAAGRHAISPGMRYLHCSRTIHQLVTDRNRAVGIYLAVASLLWTASSALLNANPERLGHLMVPIDKIQRWCLPATFATMAVLAVFVSFLLIRTRVGLIYEVAKMNVLLGLPAGRVKRINPLSIFFIMHSLVSLAGGGSAALLALHLLTDAGEGQRQAIAYSVAVGLCVCLLLTLLYVGTVRHTTSDEKLRGVG